MRKAMDFKCDIYGTHKWEYMSMTCNETYVQKRAHLIDLSSSHDVTSQCLDAGGDRGGSGGVSWGSSTGGAGGGGGGGGAAAVRSRSGGIGVISRSDSGFVCGCVGRRSGD